MQQPDDRIPEDVDEKAGPHPHTLFRDGNFEGLRAYHARIEERCQKLAQVELLAPIHGDMHELTPWGKFFIVDDLYATNLRIWSVG